jgi:DNA segregation ATPase FtsK/SpoIIIE-like protein
VRAVDLLAGTESISLSRLQRELAITYYSAARVFEQLERSGFIAPYSGSLARAVLVTREQWEERRRAP